MDIDQYVSNEAILGHKVKPGDNFQSEKTDSVKSTSPQTDLSDGRKIT